MINDYILSSLFMVSCKQYRRIHRRETSVEVSFDLLSQCYEEMPENIPESEGTGGDRYNFSPPYAFSWEVGTCFCEKMSKVSVSQGLYHRDQGLPRPSIPAPTAEPEGVPPGLTATPTWLSQYRPRDKRAPSQTLLAKWEEQCRDEVYEKKRKSVVEEQIAVILNAKQRAAQPGQLTNSPNAAPPAQSRTSAPDAGQRLRNGLVYMGALGAAAFGKAIRILKGAKMFLD